jgi:hypothetical protein
MSIYKIDNAAYERGSTGDVAPAWGWEAPLRSTAKVDGGWHMGQ